jgi:hypothetical protein
MGGTAPASTAGSVGGAGSGGAAGSSTSGPLGARGSPQTGAMAVQRLESDNLYQTVRTIATVPVSPDIVLAGAWGRAVIV